MSAFLATMEPRGSARAEPSHVSAGEFLQKISAPQCSPSFQRPPQPSAAESKDFAKALEQALGAFLPAMEPNSKPGTSSCSQPVAQPSATESNDFVKAFERGLSAFLPAMEPKSTPGTSGHSQPVPHPSATEAKDFVKAFEQALSAFLPAMEPNPTPGTSGHSQPDPVAVREDPVPRVFDFFDWAKQLSSAASKTDQVRSPYTFSSRTDLSFSCLRLLPLHRRLMHRWRLDRP